jgi:lysophospholipase L1-like esterase
MPASSQATWPGTLLAAALVAAGSVPALDELRAGRRARADLDRIEHGYYEDLLDAGRRLDESGATPPPPFKDGPLALPTADLRECVLKPALAVYQQGARWSTSPLGLRDRDHALQKPPHTVRLALLGDSIGAGWGVDDGQGFEPRTEAALDAASRGKNGPAVEIVNLAVPGYAPGQRWDHFRRLGTQFHPDLLLYQATAADLGWDERRLRFLIPRGVARDDALYRETLDRAGVTDTSNSDAIKAQLRPLRQEILAGAYRTIVQEAHQHGLPILWILLPRVGRELDAQERATLLSLARQAGFDRVIDLSDAFDGLSPNQLAISPDDYHPNAQGHARLADRLVREISNWPAYHAAAEANQP